MMLITKFFIDVKIVSRMLTHISINANLLFSDYWTTFNYLLNVKEMSLPTHFPM